MIRRLLNLLTLLSLLLCVAVCALWVSSYWTCVGVNRSRRGDWITGRICRARLVVVRVVGHATDRPGAISISPGIKPIALEAPVEWNFYRGSPGRLAIGVDDLGMGKDWGLGIFSTYSYDSPSTVSRACVLPLWVLVLALAVAPTGRLIGRRGHRNLQRGRCPACGYDLTGNVSGVCPECGNRSNITANAGSAVCPTTSR